MRTAPSPPRGPVLSLDYLRARRASPLPAIYDLTHHQIVTSGRAAILHALQLLSARGHREVLVPTYHCPTMITPVLLAGMTPVFYGVGNTGLPLLDSVRIDDLAPPAMLVSHYFGLPQSLLEVRNWCDRHGVALVEDCAHALFGWAGERPVGMWGDFAAASLTKFLPIPEGGVLASKHASFSLELHRPPLLSQLKGALDLLEEAAVHRRLGWISGGIDAAFMVKRHVRGVPKHQRRPNHTQEDTATPRDDVGIESMISSCDMARTGLEPLAVTRAVLERLCPGESIHRRQANYLKYLGAFRDVNGARPLAGWAQHHEASIERWAPYVFPLWVDDAERVYQGARKLALPVLRWDRIWPGTPNTIPGDRGPAWSRHVLQLLCHQDLDDRDIANTIQALQRSIDPQGTA